VFWKIAELLIRLIYFRRFRHASQIGKAGHLSVHGEAVRAMEILNRLPMDMHESLWPLRLYTQGRTFDALSEFAKAEASHKRVLELDPGHLRAKLELAVLTGRDFRFDECRRHLQSIAAAKQADEETLRDVQKLESLLSETISGAREKEFRNRADRLAKKIMDQNWSNLASAKLIDNLGAWTLKEPVVAEKLFDDVALLVGEILLRDGAKWKISLAIDASLLVRDDNATLNPFMVTAQLFGENSSTLKEKIDRSWESQS